VAGFHTTLHVQNAGSAGTTATLRVADGYQCGVETIVGSWSLDPGEAASVPMAGLLGRFLGSARVTASGPLAVVADLRGRGALTASVAVPARIDVDAAGYPVLGAPATALYGPLSCDPEDAWDVGVQVYNLDYRHVARVQVDFRDDSGAVVSSLDDNVCPAGAQTFFLPVVNTLGEDRPGSVWVTSIRTVADPAVAPAPMAGVVTLYRYSDPQRTELLSAAAYNMVPAQQGLAWRGDAGGGEEGLRNGLGVVALSDVSYHPQGSGVVARLALNDLVLAPGHTDAAVLFFDQNGLVDVACRRIFGGRTTYLDLAAVHLPPGFRGAAVVSAAAWLHPVLDPATGQSRNLVGLAAAMESFSGGGTGDIAGDVLSVAVGAPLAKLPWPAGQPIGDLCGVGPTATVTATPGHSETPAATSTAGPSPTATATLTVGPSPTPPAATTTAPPEGGRAVLPWLHKGL
jgi:hypothetical protein